jgi:DNA/RNA endonuclease G (NUC1)/S1-C subfamily serine protease
MKKGKPTFDEYYLELQAADPDVRAEMDAALVEAATIESADGTSNRFIRETIVLTKGRPVLDIKGGAPVIDISEVESQIWKQRLTDAAPLLAPHIPAVGRIELLNHPRGVEWLGTGWLLRDNVVVTNRHVAEIFGEANGADFIFRPGFDGSAMRADIDFLEEFGGNGGREFPLFKIVHIERGDGPDLAFLRIEPVAGQGLPSPIALESASVQGGEQVAVIGYPARDPFFPDPDLMDRIFNHRYDKKRLAPGMITDKTNDRIFHDCSTLGGNSGGEVVSLKTGKAVALHFAGTLFTKNHAVPIDIVAQRLDDVLHGRVAPPPRVVAKPSEGSTLHSAPAMGTRFVEATIPVKVRVEIGDFISSSPIDLQPTAWTRSPVLDLDADDDLIETIEARPEDYRDREGYDSDFLGSGFSVPLPVLTANQCDILNFTFDGQPQTVLRYHRFSVVMSESRRMCRFSACNIDGKQSKRTSRAGWQFDPRMPQTAQIMKECYGNPPKFSRGHMTRREDPAWGDDANLGNRDSMHVTNTVPQIQPFNGGIWLDLEDYALQKARHDDMRICVFTGPFLANDDPVRFEVKAPVIFWKVLAFIHDQTGQLCATGYTMSQKSFIGEEEFVFGRHENDQRPIHEIERRAGLSFGPLAALDPLHDQPEAAALPLTHPSQIRFL